MATGNFDILVQLHEKALNKALAMVFYSGMLKIEDTYEVDTDLPANMKPYTTFDYEISLSNEPFVDFRGEDEIFLRFSAALELVVLSGIKLKFNVGFYARSMVQFDIGQQKMFFQLHEGKLTDITINTKYHLSNKFKSKLNKIIDEIIDEYFKNEIKELEIPIALSGLTLPYMPAGDPYKLPIGKVEVKILDNKVLCAGISLWHTNGSLAGIPNLSNGKDCYIAVREAAVLQIFDFWWNNTTFDKKQSFDVESDIGFADAIGDRVDGAIRVATLGFLQRETDYENVELNYGGEVTINEMPTLDFKEDDLVEIGNLNFVADLYANIYADVIREIDIDTSSFIPDHWTPWKDDITIKKIDENRKILDLKNTFALKVNKAEGSLIVNDENNLAVKVTEADFKIEFNKKGSTFSDNTWSKLMIFLKDKVLERIPPIVISPSMILADKNVYGFTLAIADTTLDIGDHEVEFATNVVVNELKSQQVAVPIYIGNKETKVVHRLGCTFIPDIDIEDRAGYFVMYEALAEGYKACSNCLKAYKIK